MRDLCLICAFNFEVYAKVMKVLAKFSTQTQNGKKSKIRRVAVRESGVSRQSGGPS